MVIWVIKLQDGRSMVFETLRQAMGNKLRDLWKRGFPFELGAAHSVALVVLLWRSPWRLAQATDARVMRRSAKSWTGTAADLELGAASPQARTLHPTA